MFSYRNRRYRECRNQVATIVVCLLIMAAAMRAADSSIRYTEVPLLGSLFLAVVAIGQLYVELGIWERSTEGQEYAANPLSQFWLNQRRVEFRRAMDRIVLWMSAKRDEARTEDDPLWRDQS